MPGSFYCTSIQTQVNNKTLRGKLNMAQLFTTRKGRPNRLLMTTLASAISSIIAGGSSGAFAQAQGNGQELEEIAVTGTRIRQTSGFTTPVPVTAVTTSELFDLAPSNTVAAQLNALPQFFGNQTMENQNVTLTSTSGTSSLNLRNLSGNRTLVLFDGYRVVPSSKEGTVHVDFFPTALVRSVDVVTGGASAAYGADAVGGVTNFVLDRQFEGFKLNASTGISEMGDDQRYSFSVAGGRQFGDRLNVIASYDRVYLDEFIREADDVPQMKRVGWVTNPAWSPGNTSVPQRLTLPNVGSTAYSVYGLIKGTNSPLDWHRFTPDGKEIVPFSLGDISSTAGQGTTESMAGGTDAAIANRSWGGGVDSPEVETDSAFVGLEYQVSDTFSVFAQGIWGRTVNSDIQERGAAWLFSNTMAPTVYRNNAYLPASVAQIMDARGMQSFRLHKNGALLGSPDLGYGYGFEKRFTTTSVSAGFDWDLPFRDWQVRGVYQSGETERFNTFAGKWRMDRAFLAMDAVRDPATGAIVCNVQLFNPTEAQLAASPAVQNRISSRSAPGAVRRGDPGAIPLRSPIGLDNTVRDCVPFNIMGAGQMSQAALDYVHGGPKFGIGNVQQDFAEILLTGELHEGWTGPIGFAAGLTWRDQSFSDHAEPYDIDELGPPLNDLALGIRGIPTGYTGGSANLHYISTLPTLSGDAGVWEWFAETNIPVWEGNIGSQAQRLSFDAAFRQSDYDRSGAVDSWKMGVDYQFLNDMRLRYTLSTDVREPTFSELYDAQPTLGSIEDARFNNTRVEITIERGGNPDLSPEVAKTVTAGLVWTPTDNFLDGLRASVDYYDVEIDGSVGLYGIQRIADECFNNNLLCDQVRLDANGGVTKIFDVYQNVAQATVTGVDMEVAYSLEPNFFGNQIETFTLRGLAGYVIERTDTPLNGSARDTVGSRATPELTGLVTANYGIGPWSFQMQGRFTDSTLINSNWVEGRDVDVNTLPSITWWNTRIGYRGETSNGGNWGVALNVQNVFDKKPIIVPSISTRGAIQALAGDTLGRRYNLNVNYNF
jgi:outer membrane receptor protein involved in Fe transport